MRSPTDSAPVVRWAAESDIPAALECYARNGYEGGVRAGDVVLVAERADRVVGVVRLVDEEGHRVLRGMFLDAAERGRGLGIQMLRTLKERVGLGPCWLVCRPHLVKFYGRAGFSPAAESAAPQHLRARAIRYARDQGPHLVLGRP